MYFRLCNLMNIRTQRWDVQVHLIPPGPPHPIKCSLFSHYLKGCLRQRFWLFRTLISKVDMGEKVKKLLTFLTCALLARCLCCSNMVRGGRRCSAHKPAGCFKSPRLFLLRLFIIPRRGQINHRTSSRYSSPSHLDSLLYLFFVLSLFVHICIALEGKQFKNQTN